MELVTVEVWDATGTKRQEVQMPYDAPINRILAVLLEMMIFPQYAPDGQPLSYKFHHRASGWTNNFTLARRRNDRPATVRNLRRVGSERRWLGSDCRTA